jgi:RecA-family ATPase
MQYPNARNKFRRVRTMHRVSLSFRHHAALSQPDSVTVLQRTLTPQTFSNKEPSLSTVVHNVPPSDPTLQMRPRKSPLPRDDLCLKVRPYVPGRTV